MDAILENWAQTLVFYQLLKVYYFDKEIPTTFIWQYLNVINRLAMNLYSRKTNLEFYKKTY